MLHNGKPIPAFRQGDDVWDGDVLGFSRPRVDDDGDPVDASRLGTKGCFVSSLSNCTVLSGVVLNPRQVNEAAKAARAFASGTGSLILEAAAKRVGLCAPESHRVRDLDIGNDLDLTIMRETINLSLLPAARGGFFVDGGFALINFDHTGDGNPDHWCTVVSAHSDGGWSVLDPVPGASFRLLESGTGVVTWGRSKKTGRPITKTMRAWGVAPIGKVLAEDDR
jgi:hypothetical protein